MRGLEARAWAAVDGILEAGFPVAVAVTGGGSRAVSCLLNHPGASRVIVEAQIPYHETAIERYLDSPGPHPADEETSRRLARTARERALGLTQESAAIGLGGTAALATDRERRGEDRAFTATRDALTYRFAALRFEKGAADRLAQEEVVSAVLVAELASACGAEPWLPELPPWACADRAQTPADASVEALLSGDLDAVEMAAPGLPATEPSRQGQRLFVPGSFHPFHAGHAGLAAAAEDRCGRRASFELSVRNVDKPPLPYRQILTRASQERDGRCLVLTREPTFLGKARIFPGCWFAIGYDTAVRLVGPEYYDGTRAGMEKALGQLQKLGCRFLVAGRHWEGEYRGLAQVQIPPGYEDLLEEIPESDFRMDVSSTQLRGT